MATGYINKRPVLASTDGAGTIQIWDLTARVVMGTPLIGHIGNALALTIVDFDGLARIVSGGRDHTVRIWNLESYDGRDSTTNIDDVRIINMVTVETRQDGRQIVASSSSDKHIRIWDLATGSQIGELMAENHVPGKVCFAMRAIHDRLILVTLGTDQTLRAYDLNDSSSYSLGTLGGLFSLTITKQEDQFIIVSVCVDEQVDVWTWPEKQIPPSQAALRGPQSFFSSIHRSTLLPGQKLDNLPGQKLDNPTLMGDAFSRTISDAAVATLQDGRLMMISVSLVGAVRVWDLMQGELIAEFSLFDVSSVSLFKVAIGEWDKIPIGALGTRNGQVLVWDVNSGAIFWNERIHSNAVQALLIGQLSGEPVMVSGGDDGTVRVCWLNRLRDIVIDVGYSVHALALAPPDELVIAGNGGLLTLQIALPTTSVSRTLIPRGFIYAEEINREKAIAHFSWIIESGRLPAELVSWILLNRGLLHAQQKSSDHALADYSRVIAMPKTPAETLALALLNRGLLHAQQKSCDHALADYNRVIELPGTPMALLASTMLNRGNVYVQQGDADRALADYTYVLELPGASDESMSWALFNRGSIYAQRGDTERALADYTRAIELPGPPVEPLAWVLLNRPIKPVAWSLLNRGLLYAKQGNPEGALADFTRAIELPGVPVGPLARASLNRGFIYTQQGRRDEALADYTRVIELPGAPVELLARSLNNRGFIYFQQGKRDEAFTDYTRVLDLRGAPVEAVAQASVNRGTIYVQQGKRDEALADYTRVIELPASPQAPVAWASLYRGNIYFQQSKRNGALADYTRILGLPGAPVEAVAQASVNRGTIYVQQGKRDEALADYTRVFELSGASQEPVAKALFNRGIIYAQRGDSQLALADYTHAIELPGAPVEQVAQASLNRGFIYAQQSKLDKALADYTRAIEMPGAPSKIVIQALVAHGITKGYEGHIPAMLVSLTSALASAGSNDSLRISVAIEMIKTIFESAYEGRSEELLRQVVPFISEKLPIREEQSHTILLEIAQIGRTEVWISVYDSLLKYSNDKVKKLLNQLQPMIEMLRRKELVDLDRIPLAQRAIAQEILHRLEHAQRR